MSFLTLAELIEISFNTIFIWITSRKSLKIATNIQPLELTPPKAEISGSIVLEKVMLD